MAPRFAAALLLSLAGAWLAPCDAFFGTPLPAARLQVASCKVSGHRQFHARMVVDSKVKRIKIPGGIQERGHAGHDKEPSSHAGHDKLPMAHAGHDKLPKTHAGHDKLPKTHAGHDKQLKTHAGHDKQLKTHAGHDKRLKTHAGHDKQFSTHAGHDKLQQQGSAHAGHTHLLSRPAMEELQEVDSDEAEDSGRLVEQFNSDGTAAAAAATAGLADLPTSLTELRRDPQRLNTVLNCLVVGAFVAGAIYKVATVDADLSRGWTVWEIILRVPSDNLWSYETSITQHAVLTKAATSMFAYGIGDFAAQCFRGETLQTIDLKRTARSAAAGLFVHGPMCHYWIEFMQTNLDFGGAWWNFIPKVIADQTVYSIVLNAAYTSCVVGLTGTKTPAEIWEQVRSTAVPALTSSWRFWPLIHCVSFSTIIPKDLKLLFIDFMEIIWVTILSSVANKDSLKVAGEDGEDSPATSDGLH